MLTELRAGEEYAFKHFYDIYNIPLYRKLLKLVQIDVIAEELLQDLFLKIWQKKDLIDPEQSFRAYLYRIAEHLVADHYRNLARQVKLEKETDLNKLEILDQVEDPFQGEFAQKIIHEAIATLPAQQQAVFRLCKIEGKSYEEVSQLLNISHATINTHISRASKAVKTYILKHHDTAILIMGFFATAIGRR